MSQDESSTGLPVLQGTQVRSAPGPENPTPKRPVPRRNFLLRVLGVSLDQAHERLRLKQSATTLAVSHEWSLALRRMGVIVSKSSMTHQVHNADWIRETIHG